MRQFILFFAIAMIPAAIANSQSGSPKVDTDAIDCKELTFSIRSRKVEAVKEHLRRKKRLVGCTLPDDLAKWSPLHHAVQAGDCQIASLLLEAGADPNYQEFGQGHSALHLAANLGHADIAEVLLDAKADINLLAFMRGPQAVEQAGESPLCIAAAFGAEDVVALLLKRGASLDPNKKTAQRSALHHAVRGLYKIFPDRKVAYGNGAVIKALVAAGAKFDDRDLRGGAVLHTAVENFSVDCIDHCFRTYRDQLDPNAPGPFGQTPLVLAVNRPFEAAKEAACERVIELLKEHGADIGKESGPRTPPELPLHYARHYSRSDTIRRLLTP